MAATSGAVGSCGKTPGTSTSTPSAISSSVGRCGVPRGKSPPSGAMQRHAEVEQDARAVVGGDLDAHAADLVLAAMDDVAREGSSYSMGGMTVADSSDRASGPLDLPAVADDSIPAARIFPVTIR